MTGNRARRVGEFLVMARIALGGAVFGAALSGSSVMGLADLGPSLNRDIAWSLAGYAVVLALLVRERWVKGVRGED